MVLRRALLLVLALLLLGGGVHGARAATTPEDGAMTIVDLPTDGLLATELEVVNAPEGDVRLESSEGTRIELTSPAERVGGVLKLSTPILFGGTYILTVGGSSLEFEVPGWAPHVGPDGREEAGFGGVDALLVVLAVAVLGVAAVAAVKSSGRRRAGFALFGVCAAAALVGAAFLQTGASDARSLIVTLEGCNSEGGEFTVDRPSARRDCYDATLVDYIASNGLPASVRALSSAADSGAVPCHEAAHDLGRMAWLLSEDPAQALLPEADLCRLGFVHGMLEAAALTMPSQDFAVTADRICIDLENAGRPGVGLECVHGLGHSTMRRTGGDLYEAFDVCGFARPEMTGICQLGAVMEWGNLRRASQVGLVAHPSPVASIFDLCTSEPMPTMIAADCFAAGADHEPESPANPKRLILRCEEETAEAFLEPCVRGLALLLTSGRLTSEQSLGVCAELSDDLEIVCAASVGVSLAGGGLSRDEALERCGDSWLATTCRSSIEEFLGKVETGLVP